MGDHHRIGLPPEQIHRFLKLEPVIAAVFKRITFARLYFDTVVWIFVFAAEQVDFIGDLGIRRRGDGGNLRELCVPVRDKHICGLHLRI